MRPAKQIALKALRLLPRPYGEEVILDVFLTIEGTTHLRQFYDGLYAPSASQRAQFPYKTRRGLNVAIAKAVKTTLGADFGGSVDATNCNIVVGSTVQRLKNIRR